VGYSTHERPDNVDAVKVAIGLGATMFEKHVGVPTDSIALNAYSANPEQVRAWLESAASAFAMCGIAGERCKFTSDEIGTLRALQRGVFAKVPIAAGEMLRADNTFYAMPNCAGQIVANDMSKYTHYHAEEPIAVNQPAMSGSLRSTNSRERVYSAIREVRKLLKKSKVIVPGQIELEISHHYGMEQFEKFGSTIITVVNREYCKRVIVLIPGQTHPEQWHKQKDETYHILHGEISLTIDGVTSIRKANDIVVIPRGVHHGFSTRTGTVIEEVSSYYTQGDSFYTDPAIEANAERKTFVTHWMD
jgi:N-acetylneuraminate synthase